jgi:hypothetical protein
VGIEQVHRCTGEEDRTVERSVEKETLPGGHRVSVQAGTEEKELFEFCELKEESTEGSSLGC